MVIVMEQTAAVQDVQSIIEELENEGMKVQINNGTSCTVLGIIGDTYKLDEDILSLKKGVEKVMRVSEPYKLSNRKFHPESTVIHVGGVSIGGENFTVIAGPCSIESDEQLSTIAQSIKKSGADILRGGAFKPRTSPYSFQGLKTEGLMMLAKQKKETGLPVISEIMSPRHLEMFEEFVDIIQIGARNMQNFDLLKEVGRSKKPILLKRGLSSTIEEWLMSAEYIMAGGNQNVILCERGIRTFETYTRNTLDLSAVYAVKKLSHLPVLVDPSHALGRSDMVETMSLAAMAAGADGLIIEVHNNPQKALCDGPQSLTPEKFDHVMGRLKELAPMFGKVMGKEKSR